MRNEQIEQRIREKLKNISPEKRKLLQQHIDAKSKVFEQELAVREKYYPLKNLVPNIAQERAIQCYKKPTEGKYPYPIYNVFTGGNGVGKTVDLAITLAGISQGNMFVNQEYCKCDFFDMMQARRKKKNLVVWIICKSEDVMETGSVVTTITEWIPAAKFSNKSSSGYYRSLEIPSPQRGYKKTVCTIKTFDMDIVAFSGANVDMELFNEPLPCKERFDECVGRIRNGGYIAMFLTPLKAVAYLQKMVKDVNMRGILCHTKGSIWENCKDVPGTRGVLSKTAIDAQIATWKSSPITLKARVDGEFVNLSGVVFPIFNHDIHVIPYSEIPSKIDKNQMLYMCIDHHPKKPPFAVWMTLDALGVWRVIAEYPTEPWDEIVINEKNIRLYGYDFKLIEQGKIQKFHYFKNSPKIIDRFGDPNAFKCEQAHNRQTIQQQYKDDCDLNINIDIDNSTDLRHDKISDLLYYDVMRSISGTNSPSLYVYESCMNVINAFNYYQRNDNMKLDEEWKDPMDCVGYIVTTVTSYNATKVKSIQTGYDDEYEKLYGKPKKTTKKYDMYSVYGI